MRTELRDAPSPLEASPRGWHSTLQALRACTGRALRQAAPSSILRQVDIIYWSYDISWSSIFDFPLVAEFCTCSVLAGSVLRCRSCDIGLKTRGPLGHATVCSAPAHLLLTFLISSLKIILSRSRRDHKTTAGASWEREPSAQSARWVSSCLPGISLHMLRVSLTFLKAMEVRSQRTVAIKTVCGRV